MTNPNWKWRPLGELFDIGAGKTMSAAARAGTDKVPFLRTSNVLWDEIDLTEVDEMSISAAELVDKSLKAGDLLVCEGGEIGRAAVWDGRVPVMSFQNHLHRLRPIQDDVDARFYVYFLQSAFTQLGIFEGAGNKTTIPNLSRNRLAALGVPHPPPAEQQSIAQSLAKVRDAITVHDKATSTALELKHAVMNDLFTRGLRGESQKETEIGPMPESWNLVEFREIREWLQYGTSTHCTVERRSYPVLRIPNVESGRVNPSDLKYCDLSAAEASKYLLQPGDLLFIRTNGVLERLGSCAVYQREPEGALFASYLIRARIKTGVADPRYLSYFYGSRRGTSLVAGRATPAADGKYNLNTGTIDSLPLPLPSTLDEQAEIVGVLEALDRKIDLHQKKRKVLEELFKSLLHKLMTGEISVSDLDLSALSTASTQREEVAA
ncbi:MULTISPECIES: restriction endonuclease subunit S [Burkholderia]|uniref:restriction endonuclease subunit S n=1 Tax=Burkholderia TaxID=32008 RepID=UPI000277C5F4|nr:MULTISPECIES: restriction endonuclease subunit S [Burkholderia]AJY19913.1 type I restriction modification DNA specificity domain protein [Burkholderia multivorans ATCC BAA-247]AVR21545.1 restriction endonuclease [Burkholderia multivorans]EJO58285.1 type I restriction modification DNA specificity domain protein [Burkholderia multivorans ATCC BAA-247]MBU9496801.1 restriction endonuclease subunit S [Burkholderia multivorans]MCA8481838.1 restriction endonuclease subunit S [Burkholderia multivor